jgi:hypothetical protein
MLASVHVGITFFHAQLLFFLAGSCSVKFFFLREKKQLQREKKYFFSHWNYFFSRWKKSPDKQDLDM